MLKNMSKIRRGQSGFFKASSNNVITTRLSPIYDNVSGILPDKKYKTSFNFSGKIICSDSEAPGIESYISEIKKTWPEDYKGIFNHFINKKQAIKEAILSSTLREDQKVKMLNQIDLVEKEVLNG